jgi:hypothetical protein
VVATHSLIMDLLGRAKRAGELQLLEAYGGLANRLMRAYGSRQRHSRSFGVVVSKWCEWSTCTCTQAGKR